jgi:hypothetical protein
MKRIVYRVTYASAALDFAGRELLVAVFTRSINAGFGKALVSARRQLDRGDELVKVEFWEVT